MTRLRLPSVSPLRLLVLAGWLLLCGLAHGTAGPLQAHEAAPPSIQAGVLADGYAIDGRLDEPAWAGTQAIDAFTQIDPLEGVAPSARTVVRVLAGPKALVIGIDCENPTSDQPVSFSVR